MGNIKNDIVIPKGEKYFLYDEKSSLDFGLIIDTLPEDTPAEIDITKQEIAGRDGVLVLNNHRRKSKLKNITAYLNGDSESDIVKKLDNIKLWLQGDVGFKKLVLSNELDKYYEAICVNSINITSMWDECKKLLIVFECMPHKKNISENIMYITEKNTVVKNVGAKSKPYLKIVGNGDITISINQQQLTLVGIEGFIEIDCEAMNAYKTNTTTGIVSNENHKMYSDFPVLEVGTNNITWSGTGTISRIEILPKVVFI